MLADVVTFVLLYDDEVEFHVKATDEGLSVSTVVCGDAVEEYWQPWAEFLPEGEV